VPPSWYMVTIAQPRPEQHRGTQSITVILRILYGFDFIVLVCPAMVKHFP